MSPFGRLARTHAAGIGGDALFVIALAGSVFFSVDFDAARWRVALYLALTIAPFAVAAPLLGPALDRLKGGRRWVVVGSMALRAVLAFFVIRHLNEIWFYPEAFLMLVLAKVYSISKSALVPTAVRSDDELVEANSKLAVLSAIAVVAVAPFGGLALRFGGPGWALVLAMGMFGLATVLALQLPPATVATQPADAQERAELRSAGIILAASAMGLVRGIVGFLTFMLAFAFKQDGAPLWHLGVAAAGAQVGVFGGALVAPRLRRLASEETIITGCLGAVVAGGLLCAVIGGLVGAALLALLVGLAANASKQAFDAIVQRDAPDANRGRSFARFETRFQLFWVIGALLPIVVPIPAVLGFLIIAGVSAFAGGSYFLGQSQVRKGRVPVRKRRRLPVPRLRRGSKGSSSPGASSKASSGAPASAPSSVAPPAAAPPRRLGAPPPPRGSRRRSAPPPPRPDDPTTATSPRPRSRSDDATSVGRGAPRRGGPRPSDPTVVAGRSRAEGQAPASPPAPPEADLFDGAEFFDEHPDPGPGPDVDADADADADAGPVEPSWRDR